MINQYTTPIDNTLEEYIPLPLDQIFKAGQAIQQRGDLAETQNDKIQVGLASMEALAPAHRQFVSKYVDDFKKEQASLLDKYNGNTSDPSYEREARRVNMQFAADPRLKIIQQANDLVKSKQKIKEELEAKGIKYLDTNPNFTGLDESNNLSANVGTLKSVNYDSIITDRIKQAAAKMEQRGSLKSNQWNIAGTNAALKQQMFTDPDLANGIQYFMQKGMSQEQAINNMSRYIDEVSNSMISSDVDHFYENMAWDKYKFRTQQAEKASGQALVPPGMLDANQSPFVAEELGKERISKIDQVIKNTNEGGGIKKGDFRIANTPENQKKYAGKFDVDYDPSGASSITGDLIIKAKDYNPEELKLVKEAREVLGAKAKNPETGKYLSDRTVLNNYKEALSKTQAATLNYHAPLNNEYRKSLTTLEFGDNLEHLGNDYIVITKKGKFKAGSDKAIEALKGVTSVSAVGTNAAPVANFPNGTVAAEGVDKDRNTVTIIKPMSPTIARHYTYSNKASSALLSEFNNRELVENPEADQFKIQDRNGIVYVPQKGITRNGSIGISYFPLINGRVNKNATPIDIDAVQQGEHSNFFSTLGQSINTKAEDQNYQ